MLMDLIRPPNNFDISLVSEISCEAFSEGNFPNSRARINNDLTSPEEPFETY